MTLTRYFYSIPWLLLLSLFVGGCDRPTIPTNDYGLDPQADVNLLNRSLRLYGKLYEGEMPEPTGTDIVVNGFAGAVEVSAGVRLFLPYNTNNNNNLCLVYLKVVGADTYWESPVEQDSVSGAPFITISIPNFVQEGDFDLEYAVADCDGEISRVVVTNTRVSPPGECGSSFSGSVGVTVRTLDLGDEPGTVSVSYQMYQARDRLDLRYAGRWIESTGVLLGNAQQAPNCALTSGFVSGVGTLTFEYDPRESRSLQVYITGCASGTLWDITVSCPD